MVYDTYPYNNPRPEMWRSDGTQGGTTLVKAFCPGKTCGVPGGLTVFQETLYFSADDGVSGLELWASDGSQEGTRMVKDIYPGSQAAHPSHLTPSGGRLFFSADNGFNGDELSALDFNRVVYPVFLPALFQ